MHYGETKVHEGFILHGLRCLQDGVLDREYDEHLDRLLDSIVKYMDSCGDDETKRDRLTREAAIYRFGMAALKALAHRALEAKLQKIETGPG